MDDGEIVVYRERRLIPRQEDHVTMQTLVRTPEERIDQISRRALGDPSQFWQLCDANVVMNPHDLLEDPRALVNVPAPLFKVTR